MSNYKAPITQVTSYLHRHIYILNGLYCWFIPLCVFVFPKWPNTSLSLKTFNDLSFRKLKKINSEVFIFLQDFPDVFPVLTICKFRISKNIAEKILPIVIKFIPSTNHFRDTHFECIHNGLLKRATLFITGEWKSSLYYFELLICRNVDFEAKRNIWK